MNRGIENVANNGGVGNVWGRGGANGAIWREQMITDRRQDLLANDDDRRLSHFSWNCSPYPSTNPNAATGFLETGSLHWELADRWGALTSAPSAKPCQLCWDGNISTCNPGTLKSPKIWANVETQCTTGAGFPSAHYNKGVHVGNWQQAAMLQESRLLGG